MVATEQLRKNDRIRWTIASANRDPTIFPDPGRFDIGRHPNPPARKLRCSGPPSGHA